MALGLSGPQCKDASALIPTTTAAPKTLPTDVRLPPELVPTYYNLELKPDIYGNDPDQFRFEGYVEIFLNCTASTSVIVVHVTNLTIIKTSIKVESLSADHTAPRWRRTEEDEVRQFYKVHMAEPLTEGKQYVLKMKFNGPLIDGLDGLYWSTYTESGDKK